MRGVYTIVDLDTLERAQVDPLELAKAVLDGGAAALQLRAKHAPMRVLEGLAGRLAELSAARSVPFFVNDRADLALVTGATGVHVGQDDLSVRNVRALAQRAGAALAIGLSTHDEAQLEAALEQPIDYLAIGPVAPTRSKERHDPVLGVERAHALAAQAKARRPALPVVAIGGIDLSVARALAGHVELVAVIGAVMPEPGAPVSSAAERVRRLTVALSGVFA